jgi:Flp pilus assembly protein TadD
MSRMPSQQPIPTSAKLQQMLQQANALQAAGRFGEAIPTLETATILDPKNASILRALATCLVTVERLPEARRRIEQLLALDKRDAKAHAILAYSYKREAAWDEALRAIDRAIALEPGQPGHVASKAEILHMAGRSDEALAALDGVLAHASTVPSIASVFAMVALKTPRMRDALQPLETILARTDLPANARIKYTFDLAALYDALGEVDKAWATYVAGNALKKERWAPVEHESLVETALERWTKDAVARLPASPCDGAEFIFIVGMPRSGTSLVEQIISTAPGVHAAGERNELLRCARDVSGSMAQGIPWVADPAPLLDPAKGASLVAQQATAYRTALRALAPNAARITDKMPPNLLNLGLIRALLPKAKILHCTRDPMDSCLSCFFHLFGGSLPFAYRLDHCGRFARSGERLMQHWREVLGLDILDVPYEALVAEQEAGARRIFEFLGLPYSDQALRFHESGRATLTASSQQVREPIHTRSVARWKKYEAHLAPLRAALA